LEVVGLELMGSSIRFLLQQAMALSSAA